MSENSGWVKYAVVGIIVVIAIVAALILLGIVELPERGGDGAVGTTQQQPQSNPFFGFIPVAIVAIIALFLVKFLHKKKEESGTIPSGAQQPPPQEGRVDLVIEPPQWANFEFSGSKEQKFTYKVTNRTPKELKEVDVAFNYQEKDDEKFSVVRNARTQINLVPAGGTAEGEFYIKSTVPANKWVAEQTGIHAYVWWRDEVGQPWRTDYAAVGLSWDSPTPVPQTPLKLKIRPVSGSPIGITFQEGDAAKDVEFEIINEGIDDVKNCELRIAADAAFLGISNGGVFPIDLINGGGGNKTGQFSVKPTVLSGKLSNLVETAFTCVVFKSHGSTEQISNIVSVPVVLVPKARVSTEAIAGVTLEVRPTTLVFSENNDVAKVDYALVNKSGVDLLNCKIYVLQQKKGPQLFKVVGGSPIAIGNTGNGGTKTNSFSVECNMEDWDEAYPLVAVATFTSSDIRGISNRIILNAIWKEKGTKIVTSTTSEPETEVKEQPKEEITSPIGVTPAQPTTTSSDLIIIKGTVRDETIKINGKNPGVGGAIVKAYNMQGQCIGITGSFKRPKMTGPQGKYKIKIDKNKLGGKDTIELYLMAEHPYYEECDPQHQAQYDIKTHLYENKDVYLIGAGTAKVKATDEIPLENGHSYLILPFDDAERAFRKSINRKRDPFPMLPILAGKAPIDLIRQKVLIFQQITTGKRKIIFWIFSVDDPDYYRFLRELVTKILSGSLHRLVVTVPKPTKKTDATNKKIIKELRKINDLEEINKGRKQS